MTGFPAAGEDPLAPTQRPSGIELTSFRDRMITQPPLPLRAGIHLPEDYLGNATASAWLAGWAHTFHTGPPVGRDDQDPHAYARWQHTGINWELLAYGLDAEWSNTRLAVYHRAGLTLVEARAHEAAGGDERDPELMFLGVLATDARNRLLAAP